MILPQFLFIDGSNLYNAQSDIFGLESYMDFGLFIGRVERYVGIFDSICFYCSYSRGFKPEEKKYVVSETFFYSSVKACEKVVFFKGYRSKRSGREKLVDVKLSVDMVSMAYRKLYGNVFLLSGDADFLSALNAVRDSGIEPELLCMQNRIMKEGLFEFRSRIIRFEKDYVYKPKGRDDVFNKYIDMDICRFKRDILKKKSGI